MFSKWSVLDESLVLNKITELRFFIFKALYLSLALGRQYFSERLNS